MADAMVEWSEWHRDKTVDSDGAGGQAVVMAMRSCIGVGVGGEDGGGWWPWVCW